MVYPWNHHQMLSFRPNMSREMKILPSDYYFPKQTQVHPSDPLISADNSAEMLWFFIALVCRGRILLSRSSVFDLCCGVFFRLLGSRKGLPWPELQCPPSWLHTNVWQGLIFLAMTAVVCLTSWDPWPCQYLIYETFAKHRRNTLWRHTIQQRL